jgi:hypothetical protein
MLRSTKNCPIRRLDLSDTNWRIRMQTMLAFCVACHIGTAAAVVGYILR